MMDLSSHNVYDEDYLKLRKCLTDILDLSRKVGLLLVASSRRLIPNDFDLNELPSTSDSKEDEALKNDSDEDDALKNDSEEEDYALKNNPYYTAYAKLLLEFKKENAVTYRAALQRLNLIRRNIDSTTEEVTDAIDIGNQPHAKPKGGSSQTVTKIVKPKTLNDIMNIDLLFGKSWTRISEVWFNDFAKRAETLVAIIPVKEFLEFYRKSLKYPMFILQLSRENGQCGESDLIFIQFECFNEHTISNCTVRLTPIISYKTYGENAPECMTVEYYTDLCNGNTLSNNKEHSIEESFVLMRATYNGQLLSSSEAKCLINTLDCFYQNFCEIWEMKKLLQLFNKDVKPFKHSYVRC